MEAAQKIEADEFARLAWGWRHGEAGDVIEQVVRRRHAEMQGAREDQPAQAAESVVHQTQCEQRRQQGERHTLHGRPGLCPAAP